jgi:hypothetical protein
MADLGGLGHRFRLQINSISLAALGCHGERAISNLQRFNEDPLNVLLQLRVNVVREDRQLPELLVGLDIHASMYARHPSSFGAMYRTP